MDLKYQKTKLAILAWGIEDWIDLFFISAFVDEYYLFKNKQKTKEMTLKIIKNLLEEKILIAGYLYKNGLFEQIKATDEEILKTIKKDWYSLKRELMMGDIMWFEITEKGKEEFEYLNTLPELKEES